MTFLKNIRHRLTNTEGQSLSMDFFGLNKHQLAANNLIQYFRMDFQIGD